MPVRDADHDDFDAEDNETVPVRLPIGAEDRGHGQGEDGHELDENVQGRARGVLERITDSVADDARFVRFRLLATVNLFVFDVLLGVVPSTTGVGHHDGEHETRRDGTGEETTEALGADEQTDGDRGHDGEDTREQHFVDGRLRAHGDARHVIADDTFLAFEETRDVAELALDFNDDGTGSLTHGKHGEGGEEERQHGADDDTGEHVGVGEQHGLSQATRAGAEFVRNILDEGVHQGEGGQDGGADGETLTGGGGGVTERIESVGAVADFLRNIRGHFGDTAGVVGNRAVRISGESDTEGGQHTNSGDGDTVQTFVTTVGDVEAGDDGGDDDDRRREDGDHTDAETLDDDSRGTTGGTGVGDGLGRAVRVRRAELSGFTDEDTGDETEDHAAEVSVTLLAAVEEDFDARNGEDNDEDGGGVDTTVESVEKLRLVGVILGGDGPETDGRGEDTETGDPERQRHLAVVLGESGARDDGTAERFEKISTHTGDITNVVTNVVGNGGRVAGIIFRNVRFNLTDEIGADVSRLGVDATRDAREERDGGSTETKAREVTDGITHVDVTTSHDDGAADGVIRRALRRGEDVEEHRQAENTEGDDGETHDGAARKGNLKRRVQARARGLHGLHVRLRGDLHARPTRSRGERRAEQKADHRLPPTLLRGRHRAAEVRRRRVLALQDTDDERRDGDDER